MTRRGWIRQSVQLAVLSSTAAVLLSCVAYQTSDNRRVLRQDHPRDPGSFYALNPEGCPPAPPATPTQPRIFNLDACLEACEAGGAALESYCRGLQENWQRRLC